ncbi:hypothetical protein BofuT4_P114760.1 [Botrytis cinerea T4]|uniref:Uncharacterized protein n=1 Tax=Botryotinia fuckeliana (strain T4) TaxID=999810 RepID=G2Y280_BOTF4|nr:hypothetical protein BofuT4_P114760.1 [Botrytis cinerea T4]
MSVYQEEVEEVEKVEEEGEEAESFDMNADMPLVYINSRYEGKRRRDVHWRVVQGLDQGLMLDSSLDKVS